MLKNKQEEEFENCIAKMVTNGLSSLALGLGYELGLFDLLAKIAPAESPKTSVEISKQGNFKERYHFGLIFRNTK